MRSSCQGTRAAAVVLLLLGCGLLVPSVVDARSLSSLEQDHYGYYPDLAGIPDSSTVDKRNKGVDAWSICPPQMTDVDCFYAYLRVYARLRKAAEESDRVSMRNIGKRSSRMLSSASSDTQPAPSRLKQRLLCSKEMPPALCYLIVLLHDQRGQPEDSRL